MSLAPCSPFPMPLLSPDHAAPESQTVGVPCPWGIAPAGLLEPFEHS